ncbi:MAG: helix-turn-helix domain-containing protein [Bacillota bacterium]
MGTLLSPDQVAKRLGVSISTTYRLLQARVIPSVLVGRQVRVRESAVEDYISANERAAIEPDLDGRRDGRRRRGIVGARA